MAITTDDDLPFLRSGPDLPSTVIEEVPLVGPRHAEPVPTTCWQVLVTRQTRGLLLTRHMAGMSDWWAVAIFMFSCWKLWRYMRVRAKVILSPRTKL